MACKWQVLGNFINGKLMYHVGRKLREGEPLHSGNVEYAGGYMEDKEEAYELAKELNEKEERW